MSSAFSISSRVIRLQDDSPSYQQFRYPAGEWQVRLPAPITSDEVRIIARIKNGDDIVKLALLRNAIGNRVHIVLRVPYLPYSRADRQFTESDCCGLEVFGQLIQAMQFDVIETVDVHNAERAHFYIPCLINVGVDAFIHKAITEFAQKCGAKRITVLFPDEGARTRYAVPDSLSCNVASIGIDVMHCGKKRDPVNGALLGFDVPSIPPSQPAIIIDDICDGGGTFLGIAAQLCGVSLGLYVTHGIFSKGLPLLLALFDQIYTTDSVCELTHPRLTVFPA